MSQLHAHRFSIASAGLLAIVLVAGHLLASDVEAASPNCDSLTGAYEKFVIVNASTGEGDSKPIIRKPDGSVVFRPVFNCIPAASRFIVMHAGTDDPVLREETAGVLTDVVEARSWSVPGGLGVIEDGEVNADAYRGIPGFPSFDVVNPANPMLYRYKWDFDNGSGGDVNLLFFHATVGGDPPSLHPDSRYDMRIHIFNFVPASTDPNPTPTKTFTIPFHGYVDDSIYARIVRRLNPLYWLSTLNNAAALGATRGACSVWNNGAGVDSDVCLSLRESDAQTGVADPGSVPMPRLRPDSYQGIQAMASLVSRDLDGRLQVGGPLHQVTPPPPNLIDVEIPHNPITAQGTCWSPPIPIPMVAVFDEPVTVRPGAPAGMQVEEPALKFYLTPDLPPGTGDGPYYAILKEPVQGRRTIAFERLNPTEVPGFSNHGTDQGVWFPTEPISVRQVLDDGTVQYTDDQTIARQLIYRPGDVTAQANLDISTPHTDGIEISNTVARGGTGCVHGLRLPGGDDPGNFTGIVTGTPARLTYERGWVVAGWTAMLNLVYAILVIIVAWTGLSIIAEQHIGGGRALSIREMVPRIVLGLIAAATSYWWCRLLIDLADAISGYIAAALHIQPGDVLWAAITSLSALGLIGGAAGAIGVFTGGAGAITALASGGAAAGAAPVAGALGIGLAVVVVILLLVYLGFGILILMQMIVRLVFINLLIVLAPLAMAIWILPHTAAWGRSWLRMWMIQLWQHSLQLVGFSLAVSFIRGIAQGSGDVVGISSVVWLLILAIAALYLTYKLPSLMGDQGIGEGFLDTTFKASALAATAPRAIGNIAPVAAGFAVGGPAAGGLALGRMVLGQQAMSGLGSALGKNWKP